MDSSSSSSSSIVSKARTAIHSAAAKAERVFTDIKKSDFSTDRDSDRQSTGLALLDSSNHEGESKSCQEAKNSRWRPIPIKTKKDWQERLKNIRIGKRGVEDFQKGEEKAAMSFAIFDENLYMADTRKGSGSGLLADGSNLTSIEIIPPTAVIKQLAVALDAAKNIKSMKEFLASPKDSSPVREKAGLSFSAMKSLVLGEEKLVSEFGSDENFCL
jgi:Rab3 GTPase-activating protein catalytic subunit